MVLVLVATDRWVYVDAQARAERGAPVVFATGSFRVDTPCLAHRLRVPVDLVLPAVPGQPQIRQADGR
jgi:hypothetical protein